MKTTHGILAALMLVVLTVSCASGPSPLPQPSSPSMNDSSMMMRMGGWHYRSPYGQQYFQGQDVTLKGRVVDISPLVPQPRMMRGRQLIVDTGQERVAVHLGPEWYIAQQDIELEKNDTIEVRGRKISTASGTVLMAAEIKKGDKVWVLRDNEGIPHWCAQRMGVPR